MRAFTTIKRTECAAFARRHGLGAPRVRRRPLDPLASKARRTDGRPRPRRRDREPRRGRVRRRRAGELAEARLSSPAGGVPIRLQLTRDGRIFGGNYGLELATREPVLRELAVSRREGRGEDAGRALWPSAETARPAVGGAARRGRPPRRAARPCPLQRIRVEPDGRPVIRHLGGSVVWVLFRRS